MPSSERDFALARLREAYDRVRDRASLAEFGFLALVVLFVRTRWKTDLLEVQAEVDWYEAGIPIADRLRASLVNELGSGVEPALHTLVTMPAAARTQSQEIIDRAANVLGDKATFRLVLEEFAWNRDILTPDSVAAVMTDVVALDSTAEVYDPFCRAGELLVAARAHASGELMSGDAPDPRSLSVARMNTQMHDIEGRVGSWSLNHPPLAGPRKVSRILTNPPFNAKFTGTDDDPRWLYGPPPTGNANFAWLQHVVDRLKPGGKAAVVMPNGATFRTGPRERKIRAGLVKGGCVEALISLPPSLFRETGIPVTLWLLEPPGTVRDTVLFVDASEAGHRVSRTLRELRSQEIETISGIVTEWRNGQPLSRCDAISAMPATLNEIRSRDYNLNPGLYLPSISETADASDVESLLNRLESLHATAQDKDTAAMTALRDLL